MTLRGRLTAGVLLVAVASLLGSLFVATRQARYVRDKTDERLVRLVPAARAATKSLTVRGKTPKALTASLSDAWVGQISGTGEVSTIVTPADDPGLVPDTSSWQTRDTPSTQGTVSGDSARVRMISAWTSNGASVVVALPIDEQESMLGTMLRTLVLLWVFIALLLAVMAWWVIHLGIAPLTRMTESARRIAAGDTEHRVPAQPGNDEARVLAVSLNDMIDTLRGADERIRRFMADVTHELRTPLTTLRGYSDLYESGLLVDESQVADAMRRIRSESSRMSRIIDDLVHLRGVEQSNLDLRECRLDLLLGQSAADLSAANPPRRFVVETEECTVRADADLVTQALMALGTNTVDHTPVDTEVVLSVRMTGTTARLEVSDDGPGIEERHLPHLFDRLYRVDPGRSGPGEHAGIGLSLVAAIATAHGGTFGAASRPGEGATFWFDIPGDG